MVSTTIEKLYHLLVAGKPVSLPVKISSERPFAYRERAKNNLELCSLKEQTDSVPHHRMPCHRGLAIHCAVLCFAVKATCF
jgi:ABC-type ATPase involved in cell division